MTAVSDHANRLLRDELAKAGIAQQRMLGRGECVRIGDGAGAGRNRAVHGVSWLVSVMT
jgi:hypothetical protein